MCHCESCNNVDIKMKLIYTVFSCPTAAIITDYDSSDRLNCTYSIIIEFGKEIRSLRAEGAVRPNQRYRLFTMLNIEWVLE